jgi:PPOX class probable F420-dependent enzyme
MNPLIPDTHKDLLEGPIYVVATTVMPDGQPQSSVVWWDYDGDFVRINTTRGRQKEKNLMKNPKITIIAVDPKNPYHWLEVRGVVDSMVEAGGRDHIESLSMKYTGQKYYGGFNKTVKPEDQVRVIVNIRPTRVIAYPKK